MKQVKIEISAKFGSKFQEQFARDSLMATLRSWQTFLNSAHKNTTVNIKINNALIQNLDWFNFEKDLPEKDNTKV